MLQENLQKSNEIIDLKIQVEKIPLLTRLANLDNDAVLKITTRYRDHLLKEKEIRKKAIDCKNILINSKHQMPPTIKDHVMGLINYIISTK